MKRILTVIDDAGGGLAVSSLLKSLSKKKEIDIKIFSGKMSEDFVKEFKFEKLKSDILETEVENIFKSYSPDLLLSGTGAGKSEQKFRNEAYKRNVRSIVVLDFWKDYKRRWLYSDYDLLQMNDIVFVMDDDVKKEMIEEGFKAGNLKITGHPYLDKIFNQQGKEFLSKKNINGNFLFLSQPLEPLGILNYEKHPFGILLEALKKFSQTAKRRLLLIVKLHPIEKKDEMLKDLVKLYGENFEIRFAGEKETLNQLLQKSETVIGYNSIALFEARATGKRTISINAAPVKKSLEKAMDAAGIETVSADSDKIFETLLKKADRNIERKKFPGAIENCVKAVMDEINFN